MFNDGEDFAKLMFGENAVHCGFNMIVQDAGDGKIILVAQSTSPRKGQHPLQFGSKRTHVLCMGDMVFRPHMVFASDSFRGAGLNNLITNGFVSPERWIDEGDIVLDKVSRLDEMKKHRR